jgi:hypothetical protein
MLTINNPNSLAMVRFPHRQVLLSRIFPHSTLKIFKCLRRSHHQLPTSLTVTTTSLKSLLLRLGVTVLLHAHLFLRGDSAGVSVEEIAECRPSSTSVVLLLPGVMPLSLRLYS